MDLGFSHKESLRCIKLRDSHFSFFGDKAFSLMSEKGIEVLHIYALLLYDERELGSFRFTFDSVMCGLGMLLMVDGLVIH